MAPNLQAQKAAWDWYVENARLITFLVSKVCRSRKRMDLFDEVWSEVTHRLPAIFECYDPQHPSGTPLGAYVSRTVKLYAYKYLFDVRIRESRRRTLPRGLKDRARDGASHNDAYANLTAEEWEEIDRKLLKRDDHVSSLEVCDRVQSILEQLNPRERELLLLKYVGDVPAGDIAYAEDVHVETVRRALRSALKHAAELAAREEA